MPVGRQKYPGRQTLQLTIVSPLNDLYHYLLVLTLVFLNGAESPAGGAGISTVIQLMCRKKCGGKIKKFAAQEAARDVKIRAGTPCLPETGRYFLYG